jgi:hypothetical protein
VFGGCLVDFWGDVVGCFWGKIDECGGVIGVVARGMWCFLDLDNWSTEPQGNSLQTRPDYIRHQKKQEVKPKTHQIKSFSF